MAGLGAGHSLPACSDAKNMWSYTFTPHITSWPAQGKLNIILPSISGGLPYKRNGEILLCCI